jgi:hypothetical protein
MTFHLLLAVNGFKPVIKSSVKGTVFMNYFLIFFNSCSGSTRDLIF